MMRRFEGIPKVSSWFRIYKYEETVNVHGVASGYPWFNGGFCRMVPLTASLRSRALKSEPGRTLLERRKGKPKYRHNCVKLGGSIPGFILYIYIGIEVVIVCWNDHAYAEHGKGRNYVQ